MQKVFVTFILLLYAATGHAQDMFSVNHTSGTELVGNNYISVTPINKASENSFCGISPYWVGNKGNLSGYTFSFEKPVHGLLLHITALNRFEEVAVSINNVRYMLSPSEVSFYKGACNSREDALILKGSGIGFSDDAQGRTGAVIKISNAIPIYTFQVTHLNGKSDGVVFDLAYSYATTGSGSNEGGQSGNGTIGGINTSVTKVSIAPNPSNGIFSINGTVASTAPLSLDVVNAIGQVVYHEVLTTADYKINKNVDLEQGIATGVYLIRLHNDDVSHTERLIINKK